MRTSSIRSQLTAEEQAAFDRNFQRQKLLAETRQLPADNQLLEALADPADAPAMSEARQTINKLREALEGALHDMGDTFETLAEVRAVGSTDGDEHHEADANPSAM